MRLDYIEINEIAFQSRADLISEQNTQTPFLPEWPWPWPDDLDKWKWPRYSEDLPSY